MDNLPEKITDITEDSELIDLLHELYCGADKYIKLVSISRREIFIIVNGFIYINVIDQMQSSYVLWFMNLDDMQTIYELYKKSLVEKTQKEAGYDIRSQSTRLTGRNYFMLGGSFTLVNVSLESMIYEQDDLIFCASQHGKYIVKINETYYLVDSMKGMGNIVYTPYTPVKSIYKFPKLLMPAGKKYFSIENEHRYAVDAYDKNNSFMCANTYDIINAETGERIKTWPLDLIIKGKWDVIKFATNAINPPLRPIEKIISKSELCLFYSTHWNLYIIVDVYNKIHELSFLNAGQLTKSAAVSVADM